MYFVSDTVVDGYVSEFPGQPKSRVYAQYRTKPKAAKWYDIVPFMASKLGPAIWGVRNSYDIDANSGEQLDIIGRIVVASRTFISMPDLNPGMFALTNGAEFGDIDGMFSALSVATDTDMSDDLYRLVIRSKISKNNGSATIEDILDGVSFLLPKATNLRLIEGNRSFTIRYAGNMTTLEKWALTSSDLVPRPQGVRFDGFIED